MKSDARLERLTADDLQRLPDDERRYELVEGWLVSEPPAASVHGLVQTRISFLLTQFARSNAAGGVYTNSGFLLARDPDTVRAPDVAFVLRVRFQAFGRGEKYFPGAPDLAVEIRSPRDRPGEIRAKVADYLEAGAHIIWVVDPKLERVTVYRSLLHPRILTRDDMLDGEDILIGFTVAVSELFDI